MEIKYGKEPLDLRLCVLRMLRKWWILPTCILAGAALFAGIYYLTQIAFAPITFVTETEYYVEYKDAITYEQQYTFYNQNTWESLSKTDLFVDTIKEKAASTGYELTTDEINAALKTTLLTDVRIVHATVASTDDKECMKITNALPEAFAKFGEAQREIDEIRQITSAEAADEKVLDNRTVPAAILGAVVAFFVTIFVMYIFAILDKSIYLPIELTRRFGIHADKGESNKDDSVYYEESSETLFVKSKDKNTTVIEKTLSDLKYENKNVKEMILFGVDEKLYKAYYATAPKRKQK
ncbi:MAG: hypothetical protein E7296_11370 [Lachnospiraceae bacterium]|nr:hypothetical protein [Lachnospiraceae bacterium]